ncbi:MAG TPA: hypothetical protein PK014_06405 [Thermoanaerobaculia bacterium]|nr:hypothetical protein [Thermoanaerobaculia bacterium]HUM29384.1 hypothetical protein [Thermoanaerobaculia bacterium]HXK67630.1 hypothetical protein [Thermoanaerobaculia bacterium]
MNTPLNSKPGTPDSSQFSLGKRNLPFVFLFLLILTVPKDSWAYLDPGTGSYFFQMLIAALVGGLFAIKMFWKKILIFFHRQAPSSPSSEADEQEKGETSSPEA